VDDYAPVVAGLEHDIDQIEATVFSGAAAPTERIYSLRREATDFYRAVHPLLATFVTGFFGQNFGWLVRHQDSLAAFVVYGIGGLVVPLVLLVPWLRLRTPHVSTAAGAHDH
jgi:Mg2+ and Co2+ transporter CorA